MPLVTLSSVCKSYGPPDSTDRVTVLQDIDLSIQAGESLAIVGPSGCGKSTLLNILGTLDTPDSGTVTLAGQQLHSSTPEQLSQLRSQHIGFIFQLHHLLPQCTALENVLLPTLALRKRSNAKEDRQRAEHLLEKVGLQHRLHSRPTQLSGGERQRVAVVRALINQPQLILADEPTGALDEKNATHLTDLLLDLQQHTGVALVLVTHHQAQAQRMQRRLSIHNGRLQP
jgi:lipoprotein-releasing system ATP-binding protein